LWLKTQFTIADADYCLAHEPALFPMAAGTAAPPSALQGRPRHSIDVISSNGASAMLGTILIIVLILLLIGAIPSWGYSRSWGYGPSGGLGLVLIIVLVLVLMGRI
jgi:uncharacterized membrane protein YkgB